ncbi:FecR family protein [Nibrella saemangeumensis]|uniref:FecR family protein n=1 Tax=Nibrella saemangeumensis TaxID=1084526 RepID=A0ABP8MM91_9BACT
MRYDDFTVEDFVLDPDFQQWAKAPDVESDRFWQQWLAEHPDKAQRVTEARRLIQAIDFPDDLTDADVSAEWQKLQPMLDQPRTQPAVAAEPVPLGGFWRQYGRYAAVFLAVLLSVAGFYLWRQSAGGMVQVATGYGETWTVQLPDGSTVVLNANSSLAYPRNLKEQAVRQVKLNGEAFFSVVHTATDQRFVVDANSEFNVEVLGTEFTVTRRNDHAQVMLASGKVRLQMAGQQMVMQPGELVDIQPKADRLLKKQVNPEVYTSWTENQLIFENTSLTDIARLLEDNYGLTVTIEDETLAQQEFNGTFPSGNVDVLLKALERTYQLQITRQDNQILIRSQRTKTNL